MITRFGEFELDESEVELRRSGVAIELQPKVFDLLAYLVQRRDRVVSRSELFAELWPDVRVGEAALNRAIRVLRRALEDDGARQTLIRTFQRRGYRFVAPVGAPLRPASLRGSGGGSIVGRDRELEVLARSLEAAAGGARGLVVVAGEAGIGKTALLDAFVARASGRGRVLIARASCAEVQGPAEAYRVFLDALEELGRVSGGAAMARRSARFAPSWAAEIPWLRHPAGRASPRSSRERQREQGRMAREFHSLIEAFTKTVTLALVLDDVQWADASSVDLLLELAQRASPARLLLVAAHRTPIAAASPLLAADLAGLYLRGASTTLPLGPLGEPDLRAYLAARLQLSADATQALAHSLYKRTDGVPLFALTLLGFWLERGLIAKTPGGYEIAASLDELSAAVPGSLHAALERQVEQLPAEGLALLEVASVAGAEFSSMEVAAATGCPRVEVEALLDALVRRGGVVSEGDAERNSEGLRVPRYRFVHELLREVLERRVLGARRAEVHRGIADLLDANRSRRSERLADLARHLEGADLPRRAARVRAELARVSVARSGYPEAARHLELALKLLERTTADPERDKAELELRMLYFLPLHATRGYGAPEAARNAIRASELASATGEVLEVAVLGAPWTFHLVRAELDAAERLALRSLGIAERLSDPALELAAHVRLGTTLFYRGRLTDARRHLERAEFLYDVERDGSSLPWNDLDLGVASSAYLAWTLFMLGEEERALERVDAAIELARQLERPHSEALALDFAASLHAWRGDVAATRESADAAISLSERLGFPQWLALGLALRGWARAHADEPDAGIAEMSGAIQAYRAAGANLSVPYFLALLADSLSVAERHEQAGAAIAEALELAERSGERYHAAELRRLQGEVLLAGRAPHAAERARRAFDDAIAIARSQSASALERRALASIARLDRGKLSD